jgi:hypothetical protein
MRRAAAIAVFGTLVLAPNAMAIPVITSKMFGTTGDNGWYRSSVTVNWTVVDPTSPIISEQGCDPTTITADTPPSGTVLTCTATSQVDASHTVSTTEHAVVLIDRVPPGAISAAPASADNGGWFNHPVQVTWAGTDGGSGIGSCTSTAYSGPDATGVSLTGSCRDKAGNVSTSVPYVFSYDATPPVLTSVTAAPDNAGARLAWQASGATRFMVTRSAAGARAAQSDVVYDGTGAGFSDTGLRNGTKYTYLVQAVDTAGNAASGSAAVTPNADASTKHLLSPGSASSLSRPPMLRWRKIARASYYNVQLFRHGKKILSAWPTKPHYQLRRVWTYRGHRHRLGKATYKWLLWGGYGRRSEHRYGKLLGKRTFVVT